MLNVAALQVQVHARSVGERVELGIGRTHQPRIGRVVAEERRALAEHVDARAGGGRRNRRAHAAEAVCPAHARALRDRVERHRRDDADVPAFAADVVEALLADDEDRVARLHVVADAREVEHAVARRRMPCERRLHGKAFHSTRASTASTVSKLCACSSCPGTLCTRVPAAIVTGAAGGGGIARHLLQGERQVGAGRDARRELVADQPGQLEDRAPLGRGTQEVLVRDALLVEAEHVERDGERIAERDREVRVLARAEAGERGELGRRQACEERFFEPCVHARAIRDRALPRRVVDARRRLDVRAGAAAAGFEEGRHHLPPKSVRRSTPCSGKFGSLSRRGISSRAERHEALRERQGIHGALALEARHLHRGDARDLPRGGVERTEVDGLAERQVVGMEQAAPAVGQRAVAEHFREARAHVAPEMARLHAHEEVDLERHVHRIVELRVVTRHAIAIDVARDERLEVGVDRQAARAIDRDEHRVPAPGPAQGGGGPLDVRRARSVTSA